MTSHKTSSSNWKSATRWSREQKSSARWCFQWVIGVEDLYYCGYLISSFKTLFSFKSTIEGLRKWPYWGTSGREISNFRENTVPRSFYQISSKKRQHFPNFSLVDNFINHTFCDEGETDFFRSGIGDGLEESVYFCACHLGWEGVITV